MNSTPARPVNVSYLVIGLVFLGIAGTWALHVTGLVDGTDVEWLVPLSLVVAGVLGLVAFAVRGVRGRRSLEAAAAYDTNATHDNYETNEGETR